MTEALHTVSPEGNFTVEASAGTGKTWLLTSRIVRLLLAGTAPGSILAITFTRKAAAEIRQRIHERLLTLALGDDAAVGETLRQLGADAASARTRETARGLFEAVLTATHPPRISTIHAFCQDLLQRFPLESRLPPGFQVTEAPQEAREAAWGRLLRDVAARDPDDPLVQGFEHLLRWLESADGVREALNAFIDHRDDWWAYTETMGDPVTGAARELEQAIQPKEELPAEMAVRTDLTEYGALLGRHNTATFQQSARLLGEALTDTTTRDDLLARVQNLFHTANGARRVLKPSGALEKSLGGAAMDRLVDLHKHLGEVLDRWKERELCARNLEHNHAWFICGNALLAHFQTEKRRREQVDFADLEWQTYLLLNRSQHAEWIQYKLDQRIDHLLIDEFQDTSPVQWQLLQPLLHELAAGDPERQRSVFLVGDTKQSIYRFRRAQPELFARARQWMRKHIEAGDTTQQRSRRSSPAIMEFVNLVFAHDPAGSEAHPYPLPDFARHDTHHQELWGRVELLPLAGGPAEPNGAAAGDGMRNPLEQARDDPDAILGVSQEARQIVDIIGSLLGQAAEMENSVRPIGYGDFLILVRNRTHVDRIEQQLREARIPYSGAARDTLAELPEVQDIVRLLLILLSPLDNVALASVLRSPIFACSDGDLVELARLAGPFWWQRLQQFAETAVDREHPLAYAFHLLASWRPLVDRIPVHDLLDRIYADTNLIQRYLHAAPTHYAPRLVASLNHVLDFALDVDSGRYPSVSRFVHSLTLSPMEPNPANPVSGQEGRVRVMTIHSAKGLEAPVVILADAARVPREPGRRTRAVVAWPSGASRPEAFRIAGRKEELDESTRSILQRIGAEQRREEANLLYVALTRARQYLFITATGTGNKELGWYGHMARRIGQADVESTLAPGTTVSIQAKDGDDEDITGRHFLLRYGQAPFVASEPTAPQASTRFAPMLSRIPPPVPADDFLNPSAVGHQSAAAVAGGDTETEPGEGRIRGILIHRALELLAGRDGHEEAHRQWLHDSFSSPASLQDSCWQEAVAVVRDPTLRPFFDPSAYEWARNELPLLFRTEEGIVYGVADRVVANSDGLWLVDYKTHTGATPDTVDEIARGYVRQLQLYADGVARLWPGRPVHPMLLFTACRMLVPATPNDTG